MSSLKRVPPQFQNGAAQTAQQLAGLDYTLVAAHVSLDGDALGSIAACGYLLKSLGRQFALYSSTGVPRNISFTPLPGPVYTRLADLPFSPHSAVYLDCSEPARLGKELAQVYADWPSVNIDHHITERGLGSLANFIFTSAAATSQLVAYVAMELEIPLKDELAYSIALGLVTDTGGFCHGNTTADVLNLAARLLRNGCNLAFLREQLNSNWSEGRVRLWGELLSRVRLALHGNVAICMVTLAMMEAHGCSPEDVEGLVEWCRKIRGVKVAAFLREIGHHEWKFSLRSYGETDVREIAASLGGGGHKNAAGGTLHAADEYAEDALVEVIRTAGRLE